MINKLLTAAALTFAMATPLPASAAETLTAVFTMPDGGVTTGLYSGIVSVRVSGTGFSLGNQINDAFYLISGPTHDASFYQLTFGTSTLVALNPAQNAVNFVVGGLPAYSPTNVYTFLLNTGSAVPTLLHFGVGDGNFADNGGAFEITISAIPEPATWTLMIGGFAMVGFAARRRAVELAA